MVWPILISVSVTPGPYCFSASAENGANTKTETTEHRSVLRNLIFTTPPYEMLKTLAQSAKIVRKRLTRNNRVETEYRVAANRNRNESEII